jgi:hypothetical protein
MRSIRLWINGGLLQLGIVDIRQTSGTHMVFGDDSWFHAHVFIRAVTLTVSKSQFSAVVGRCDESVVA